MIRLSVNGKTDEVDADPGTPPLWVFREQVALTTYVARQSRGMPVDIAMDERTKPFLDAVRETFIRRQGQLNGKAGASTLDWPGGSIRM